VAGGCNVMAYVDDGKFLSMIKSASTSRFLQIHEDLHYNPELPEFYNGIQSDPPGPLKLLQKSNDPDLKQKWMPLLPKEKLRPIPEQKFFQQYRS
jgi:hypothetical protein